MLSLIGLGLFDETDMSIKGLEEAKNADSVYIELYTSDWQGSIENLEKMIGKDIIRLDRSGMEENSGKLIEEAKEKHVVIFIPGDPLVATTHSMIITDAHKEGIKTKIIHSSSIYSAMAETGLHIYKFGKSVTLPSFGASPSMIDGMNENKKRGLHTLVLSDIGLPFKEAIKMINEFYKDDVIVASRLGGDSKIVYGPIEKVRGVDIELPFVTIIPGNIHFSEEEMLDIIRVE